MKKQFKLVNGRVELNKPLPKRISQEKALDLIIEQVNFIIQCLENGEPVYRYGENVACGGCQRALRSSVRGTCFDCLVELNLPHEHGCNGMIDRANKNRRKDESYRLPIARQILAKLIRIKEKGKRK